MKITEVDRGTRKGFVKITLDNNENIMISEEDYIIQHLYEEKELSSEDLIYLKVSCSRRLAKLIALKYSVIKLRTCHEVAEKLKKMEFEMEVIDFVINDLELLGYLNDRIYVQKFINQSRNLKPKSSKKIEFELLKKGIQKNIIEEELEIFRGDDLSLALDIAVKKFGKSNIPEDILKKKIFYFLMSRGFDYDIIKKVYSKMDKKECD